MPTITAAVYDCPARTLRVTVDAQGSTKQYKVFATAGTPSSPPTGGTFPPSSAIGATGQGNNTIPVSSPGWPNAGQVMFHAWLMTLEDNTSGGKDCSGGGGSSSSSSS